MTLILNKKKVKNLSGQVVLENGKTRQVGGALSAMGCGPISNPNYSCPVSVTGYTC
ncbi:hypothetical protein [Pseudoalteromonas rubra]|uniref:hypothetical protein n=1 Tax=Pseudoalteromonas rubra TaxID=43658 RepID=UPI0014863785|nr:hypothetical protein [Pseudoalteromonas rubra]